MYSRPRCWGDGRAPPGQGASVLLWLTHSLCSAATAQRLAHTSQVSSGQGCLQHPTSHQRAERILTARWSPRPLQSRGPGRLGLLWAMPPSLQPHATVLLRVPQYGHGPGGHGHPTAAMPQCDVFTFVREFVFHKTVPRALPLMPWPYEMRAVILPSQRKQAQRG